MSDRVEIGWVERELGALDRVTADVLVGTLCEDERPPRGVLGLVDWRMCGRLSSRCLSGFLRGARAERFLMPGRPHVPFEKVLVIGLGPRAQLDEARVIETTTLLLDALAGLAVRRAAIDLPGRLLATVTPPRALEILTAALAGRSSTVEAITIIDDREAQRAVEALRTRSRR